MALAEDMGEHDTSLVESKPLWRRNPLQVTDEVKSQRFKVEDHVQEVQTSIIDVGVTVAPAYNTTQ